MPSVMKKSRKTSSSVKPKKKSTQKVQKKRTNSKLTEDIDFIDDIDEMTEDEIISNDM